ncbi:MAG: aminoacyl-tRNA hydrolase [Clostridia bacterium]|nr:aminoacyl-tRNA hydrolase [Clostridia bacterium]
MRFFNVNPGEHPEYIIVGLGNPGQRYENTRHNIGFKVVDYIDSRSAVSRGCKRMLHSSLCDKCVLDGYIIYNVKPQTFMNNSGMAVQDVMSYYKMSPKQLIVIHDDITLPAGEFRVKNGGSAGGHNGLKSIIQHIGTNAFIRIRVGVGVKPAEWDMSKYVLSKITDEEFALISDKFELIKKAVSSVFNYGIEHTLKVYNLIGANKVD